MHKFNLNIPLKTNKTKAAILTVILLLSLALPLFALPFASAAATVSISPASGPNGTAVKVTGSGFGASEATGAFTITVDGLAGKAILSGSGLVAGKQLATDAAGVLTGYFIIGGTGLVAGAHSVQISDATSAPPAVTFTIIAPVVTLTPSTGPAGTSVLVSATGFPTSITGTYTVTNTISAATFAGTAIVVSGGATTAAAATLSSNVITKGVYTGTVSLPAITTGSTFTLTDSLVNTGTTTFTLNTPTVTFSPASGPAGTLVTVVASGFGPGAAFTGSAITFGSVATIVAGGSLIPANPTVNEQGASVFQFVMVGTGTVDSTAGAHTVTVTDNKGNVATAIFTITPQVTLTLGVGAVNSGVAYAPTGTLNVVSFLSAAGFKPLTQLTITSSPGVPAGWITFVPATVTTDANGAIAAAVTSGTGTAPPSGIYSVTVTDGTNPVTILLTITSSGNFFLLTPTSGARGTTVRLTGFGATTTAINVDGSAVAATQCVGNAWPAVPTTYGSFLAPAGAGAHTVTTTGIAGSAVFTTTGAPTISVVSPSTAAVGTTVTIVGSGFANAAGVTLVAFSIDSITVPAVAVFTTGSMIATFAVPAFLPGSHTLSATDSSFNTASAIFTTKTSSVAVTPVNGTVGTATALPISITGSDFPAGQAITVVFDTTTLGAATAGLTTSNTNGGIILYTTSIAAGTLTIAGAHIITVTAGTASATATFTVKPTVLLGATAVRPGTVVAITGSGFAANSALSLALNGTATTWFDTVTTTNATTILSNGVGTMVANAAVIIPSTTVPQALNITVTDASGNVGNATLTILGTPAIVLAATQGISGVGTVGINGTGFTPGVRVVSAQLLSGTTVVSPLTVSTPMTVGDAGTFASTAGYTFTVPAVAAGTYTVNITMTLPTESAVANFTILGAPTITAATSGQVGANVTLTVVGLTSVATATFGGPLYNMLTTPGTTFGPQTPLTTGANAYNLTTWFVVPALPAGSYTILLSDGTRSATALFTIVPAVTLTPSTALKGVPIAVAGTGFAASNTFSVTFNGAVVVAAAIGTTTTAAGALPGGVTFLVPVTASLNNTVVVTDAAGNNVTTYFTVTAPTLIVNPASGAAGATVQLIGIGYAPSSPIFVQVGTAIVVTAPISITGPSFIAYITIPTGLSGNTVISATDSQNNFATANFTVGGTGTFAINQGALSSTAKTVNPSTGAPQTSFARGAQVKFTFVLNATTGSGNVVWRITLQQSDLSVLNIVTTTASVTTDSNTLAYTQLLPTGSLAGNWSANIQIFASDGVTPLAVTTVTFTVT